MIRATIFTLAILIAWLALLLLCEVAHAEPVEACARADYLAGEIADEFELIDELIEMAKPVCAEKALARECARQRIEIRARIADVKQLEAKRKLAERECKSGTSSRKASEVSR